MTKIFLTTVGAGTWTVPADCTSVQVECIGGGGNSAYNNGYCGGGGGAYSKKNSLTVTPGSSISFQVGAAQTATWFKSTSDVYADYGRMNTGNNERALASNCIGDVKYNGGVGTHNNVNYAMGGGAAGPHGDGGDHFLSGGGVSDNGGTADNSYGGLGAIYTPSSGALTNPTSGTEFDSTHGCGGGGGGPNGAGALYGGGGGGTLAGGGGGGAQGLIVLTYTPALAGNALLFGTNF